MPTVWLNIYSAFRKNECCCFQCCLYCYPKCSNQFWCIACNHDARCCCNPEDSKACIDCCKLCCQCCCYQQCQACLTCQDCLHEIGCLCYHTSLQFEDVVYEFNSDSDAFSFPANSDLNSNIRDLYQKIPLGEVKMSFEEMDQHALLFKSKFRRYFYHVCDNNCNHYTFAFYKHLQTLPFFSRARTDGGNKDTLDYPSWVNRIACVCKITKWIFCSCCLSQLVDSWNQPRLQLQFSILNSQTKTQTPTPTPVPSMTR